MSGRRGIDALPNEMLHLIFSSLPCRERYRCLRYVKRCCPKHFTSARRSNVWICSVSFQSVHSVLCRTIVLPLVSRGWAHALSEHSQAWAEVIFDQPPQQVKHTCSRSAWAERRCKLTRRVTLEKLGASSLEAVEQLLRHMPRLTSIRMTGVISDNFLWRSLLLLHQLKVLELQATKFTLSQLNSLGALTSLQQLSVHLMVSCPCTLPGEISRLNMLTSLSLRNVTTGSTGIGDGFTSLSALNELSLINSRITAFDFSFAQLSKLSSLLLSEERQEARWLSLPGLAELSSLQRLSISSRLSVFPEDILQLTCLTSLDLGKQFRHTCFMTRWYEVKDGTWLISGVPDVCA